jgi:Cys-rich protein (TIGR01571 family)
MSRSTVFGIVVGIYLLFIIMNAAYSATLECVKENEWGYNSYSGRYEYSASVVCSPSGAVSYILNAVTWIFYIAIIVVLVRARMSFRNQYKIQGNCCADCCTMFCCSCCSIIQMLRQTHDEDEHGYSCCSCMTGLQDTAPEIV